MAEFYLPDIQASVNALSDLSRAIRLQIDSMIAATITEMLQQDLFMLNVGGVPLQARSHLPLQVGQQVVLRVKEIQGDVITMQLVSTADAPELVEALELKPTRENVEIARQMLKSNLPMDRDTVQRISAAVREARGEFGAKVQAAVVLVANGIEPTPENVEMIARLAEDPPDPPSIDNPIARKVAEHVQAKTVRPDDPASLPKAAAAPPPALEEAIETILAKSPALQRIEEVLDLMDEVIAEKRAGPVDPHTRARLLTEVMKAVHRALAEKVEPEALKQVFVANREALGDARAMLVEQEFRELSNMLELKIARDARVMDLADRALGFRALNNLATLRGDGVMMLELPVQGQQTPARLLVMMRREGGGGQKGQAPGTTVKLDVTLSRIGRVRATTHVQNNAAQVLFGVRDSAVKKLFNQTLDQLVSALRAQGFEPRVQVDVSKGGGDLLEELFDMISRRPSLDLRV